VGRYWQARCLGFEVRSPTERLLGTVEAIELDRRSGRPAELLVRPRRGGSHTPLLQIDPESVVLVDPWRRLIVAAPPQKSRRTRSALETAGRGGHAAWTGAARAGPASRRVAVVARRAAPPSGRFTLWLAVRTAYALAFACWLYAATVYLVSRVATRLLLATVNRLVRISLWIASALKPAQEAIGSRVRSARRDRRPYTARR
jgi:hypothetical protein